MNFENIIELSIKQELAHHFKALAEKEGAKFINVVQFCEGVLYYIIEIEKEKHDKIANMALMTFIKNPSFQKYYHNTSEFEIIKNKFLFDREERNTCNRCGIVSESHNGHNECFDCTTKRLNNL